MMLLNYHTIITLLKTVKKYIFGHFPDNDIVIPTMRVKRSSKLRLLWCSFASTNSVDSHTCREQPRGTAGESLETAPLMRAAQCSGLERGLQRQPLCTLSHPANSSFCAVISSLLKQSSLTDSDSLPSGDQNSVPPAVGTGPVCHLQAERARLPWAEAQRADRSWIVAVTTPVGFGS